MLPFGVTIPGTVPQGSEIPEGLMNNTVYTYIQSYNTHYIFRPYNTPSARVQECTIYVLDGCVFEGKDLHRINLSNIQFVSSV